MKIIILTTDIESPTALRFESAIKDRGHEAVIVDPQAFIIHVEDGVTPLYYEGLPLESVDGVIPIISPMHAAVLRQLEQQGAFSLNHSISANISRDKLRTIQILNRSGVPVPPTAFVYLDTGVGEAIKRLGGAPVVIKLTDSDFEEGVMLAQTNTSARAIVETLQVAGKHVLVQKFLTRDTLDDYRAIVLGDTVLAAVKRADIEEESSAIHSAGIIESVDLPEDFKKTAIKAARAIGLRFATVDLVSTNSGPVVLEINPTPEITAIEKITGIDIAARVVEFIEEQRPFPDLDIRERLHLAKGYGVVEIYVAENSILAGKSFEETEFKKNGIRPLGVTRKKRTVPNPKYDFKIAAGDVIICFGKLSVLRDYKTGKADI
ncbi:MAG: RimK family alpha-L-glutamate ligase [Bdellovibrionales bacterium]|nr:RimK family alpha-L-glutamate ligase [Bdellovibrionales bacterium]